MSPRGDTPTLTYPVTNTVDQVDEYHGTLVPDPYRWLEDLDADETAAWVEAQNRVTFGYLETIPYRDRIKQRLTELWDHEKYGVPFTAGGTYFLPRQSGLQNQPVIYATPSLDQEPRVLIDPNTWSADGTVAMTGMAASDDGTLLAYGVSSGGSDWMEWKIVDVATGEERSDHLRWIKFTAAAWLPDGSGFYYSRYDEPEGGEQKLEEANYNHKVFFHRVGDPQSADRLVYERPDHKDWLLFGGPTEDGRWLIVTAAQGTSPKNAVFVQDLSDPGADVREWLPTFDAQYVVVGNDGDTMFVQTDLDSSRGSVIAIDARDPSVRTVVVPESVDALQSVSLVGERLFCHYLKDARSVVRVYRLDGTFERDVDLPGIGTVMGFGGKRADTETFYLFTSFTVPSAIYRYDIATGKSTLWRRPDVAFDPDAFETTQVFYPSKDGTKIPMFITHKRGLVLDGSNPTYLYGYGGFNVPLTPAFAISTVAWLEMGGIYASACLRGGSEYGEDWHLAGTKERKQNVFDDFIAGGEWLIAKGYTSTPKLSIGGGSNGGLLVGACITQRPDLFGAARIAVGVLDMLRFHRFTIGWAWVSDYGSAEDPDAFPYLHAYSPLHTIEPGTAYPATLITTADHDDRVVPSHSFKFASTLQPAQSGDAPILIRVDVRAGHGMGKPTAKIIEEAADAWAFLAYNLGLDELPL